MRILVEVQNLEPGRTRSNAVASYVRAVLKLRALRRELAETLLEVERRKTTLNGRHLTGRDLAEAQRLLEEFGIEAGGTDDHLLGVAVKPAELLP